MSATRMGRNPFAKKPERAAASDHALSRAPLPTEEPRLTQKTDRLIRALDELSGSAYPELAKMPRLLRKLLVEFPAEVRLALIKGLLLARSF